MSGDEFDTVFQVVARRSYPSVLGELVGRGDRSRETALGEVSFALRADRRPLGDWERRTAFPESGLSGPHVAAWEITPD